jgi:hypothetical protein
MRIDVDVTENGRSLTMQAADTVRLINVLSYCEHVLERTEDANSAAMASWARAFIDAIERGEKAANERG